MNDTLKAADVEALAEAVADYLLQHTKLDSFPALLSRKLGARARAAGDLIDPTFEDRYMLILEIVAGRVGLTDRITDALLWRRLLELPPQELYRALCESIAIAAQVAVAPQLRRLHTIETWAAVEKPIHLLRRPGPAHALCGLFATTSLLTVVCRPGSEEEAYWLADPRHCMGCATGMGHL